jgi:hypothetical protein
LGAVVVQGFVNLQEVLFVIVEVLLEVVVGFDVFLPASELDVFDEVFGFVTCDWGFEIVKSGDFVHEGVGLGFIQVVYSLWEWFGVVKEVFFVSGEGGVFIFVEFGAEVMSALECVHKLLLVFDVNLVDFEAVEGGNAEGVFAGFHGYVRIRLERE